MSLRDGERGRASFLYEGRRSTEGSGRDLNPPYYWNGAETEGIEAPFYVITPTTIGSHPIVCTIII